MAETSVRRQGEIVRKVFEVLLPHSDGLDARAVLANVERDLDLTSFEKSDYPNRPGVRRFERIARFSTIAPVKAGWLSKEKGTWVVTERGRDAYSLLTDPEDFAHEMSRLYRAWRRSDDKEPSPPPTKVVSTIAFSHPRTLFKKVDYDLAGLLHYIDIGDVGLPDIQRPFLWSSAKVRDLFDSMYRGFPVGYLLFWSNSNIQKNTRTIGLGDKQHDVPSHLIIDGQQRLTSLYAVCRGRSVLDKNFREKTLEIAFRPRDGRFEVSSAAVKNDPEFIPNISNVWAGASSYSLVGTFLTRLKAKRDVSPGDEEVISHNLDRLFDIQKYPFTALEISPDVDEEAVSDVFVRINSAGINLTQADFILTLLSVFWPDGRRALDEFSMSSRLPPSPKGPPSAFNHFLQPDPDQLLRVSIAVGFHRARLRSVYQVLRGKDPETNHFAEELRDKQLAQLQEAQSEVLKLKNWHQFLSCLTGAGFRGREMISSETTVLYCYALYLLGKQDCAVEERVIDRLIRRWFFMVNLTGRYTGSQETAMEEDLSRVKGLDSPDEFVERLNSVIGSTLTNDLWAITLPARLETSSANSPILMAYHASQNLLGAPALFSDKKIGDLLDPAIKSTKRAVEKHHLFPRAWLQANDVKDRKVINQAANFAYVEWPDNVSISATPPKEYVPLIRKNIDASAWERMSQLHALPDGWEAMPYDEFLRARRPLMAGVIRRAFESIDPDDEEPQQVDATREEREVWNLIGETERNLRQLVRAHYVERWGDSADSRIQKSLGDEQWFAIERNRERYLNQYPLSRDARSVGDVELMEFCYFGQLVQLMIAGEAWETFRRPFRDKRHLQDLVACIIPVRNDTAHFRSVPDKEFSRCRLAIDDLRALLEGLNS